MANVDNLTPWEANKSGNPAGKAKGTLNRSTVLKRYLAASVKTNPSDIPFELEGKITVEEAIALALIKKALSGDIAAIKEVQDSVYGKMAESSQISHSYTQMGNVTLASGARASEVLTFDVGESPNSM